KAVYVGAHRRAHSTCRGNCRTQKNSDHHVLPDRPADTTISAVFCLARRNQSSRNFRPCPASVLQIRQAENVIRTSAHPRRWMMNVMVFRSFYTERHASAAD